MRRRNFLSSSLAGGLMFNAAAATSIPKRAYRDGVNLSVIGFGGIVVVGHDQSDANRIVAESVDRGINYFDVAPTYGDGEAEQKLGPALEPFRKNAFLACKTTERTADGARRELEQSLKRLRTDHFDLYQFHAVTTQEDVDKILAPGGAAELFVKARKEGKVRYLGCSAHSASAAIALMDRFPLDSILFPVNYVLYSQGSFGPQILEHAKQKGVARLALKSLAKTRWAKGEKRDYPRCWYRPVSEPELAKQALRFTLSEDLTAAIPPGDVSLYRMALDLAAGFKPLSQAERDELLASAQGLDPLFRA
ncbi:MAG TPA: aldo/keto reductase [Bryobacteraceae bacterium]|nr:aldo/keto reductase [Bryobacteraceae bacterium]